MQEYMVSSYFNLHFRLYKDQLQTTEWWASHSSCLMSYTRKRCQCQLNKCLKTTLYWVKIVYIIYANNHLQN